jgi:hypothetical protein
VSVQVQGFVCEHFITKINFYSEELLAPRPTPKLEHHLLSAVRDCLFNIFTATLHIGGCSSIRNPRTRHAMVTGTHLQHGTICAINPLPVQFISLLPGQEGCVFFQRTFKYTYLPLRFTTLRPAGGISFHYVLLR